MVPKFVITKTKFKGSKEDTFLYSAKVILLPLAIDALLGKLITTVEFTLT